MLSRGQVAVRTAVSVLRHAKKSFFFAYQICKPQFLSVVKFPFDNCHSPFSLTFFGSRCICENFLIISLNQLLAVANLNKAEPLTLNFRQSYYVQLVTASHVIWHGILVSRHLMTDKK